MAALVLLGMAEEVPETLSVAVAVAESEPEALLVAVTVAEPELTVDEATEDTAESVPVEVEPSIVLVAELTELAALDGRDVLDD